MMDGIGRSMRRSSVVQSNGYKDSASRTKRNHKVFVYTVGFMSLSVLFALGQLRIHFNLHVKVHDDSFSVQPSESTNNKTDINTIVVKEWWRKEMEQFPAVVYPFKVDHRPWCRSAGKKKGIMLVKNHKAASSTAAGVTIRIAHQVARRLDKKNATNDTNTVIPCTHHYVHRFAEHKQHRNRLFKKSLLWSVVRHPAERSLSAFYYYIVASNGEQATDDRLLRYLERTKNVQVSFLSPTRSNATATHSYPIYEDILKFYDFIGVAERMDESLVALKHVFGLELTDVIVLSSKQTGSYSYGSRRGTCIRIPPKRTSLFVKDYLATNFPLENYDYVLWAAANRALDATLDRIGQAVVEQDLQALGALQERVQAACLETTLYPCSANGTDQIHLSQTNCYDLDFGCGYPCVDRVLEVA